MSATTPNNATQDVFDYVLARAVAAPDLQHGRLIHVQWSAPDQDDRLVQLYANNSLAGHTLSPQQRAAWLICQINAPMQIELLAVEPADVGTPWPTRLAGVEPATQPVGLLTLLRDQSLPIDATLSVSIDGGADAEQIALFPADAPRGGFGAVFGQGGFGYDASTGPGLGLGQLGFGPLGADGTALRWRHDTLSPGDHTLDLSLKDSTGRSATADLALDLTISRLPEPATDVALNGDLQLSWT